MTRAAGRGERLLPRYVTIFATPTAVTEAPGRFPERDTVSIHFVRAALAGLSAVARRRVLRCAGIPAALLTADSARVTAAAFAALWLAVNEERDDEFFGLDARRMKVGSFALITYAVLHSRNLEQALRRMLRAFSVLLDDLRGELRVEGGTVVLALDTRIRPQAARRFAEETFLVMVYGLACWLVGRRIALRSVRFGFTRPAHAAEHAVMFTREVAYAAPRTELRFDAAALALRVVQNEATVKDFLREAPQSVFLKYKNLDSWSRRVRRRLRRADGERWPGLAAVAAEFNVAPSTLGRRLEAEGTSFQRLKDEVRRDLAIHRLHETRQRVDEIARALGFGEASAFRRAFKKWTGSRPASYRAAAS
jgi:AraC-like DNA-binding protein